MHFISKHHLRLGRNPAKRRCLPRLKEKSFLDANLQTYGSLQEMELKRVSLVSSCPVKLYDRTTLQSRWRYFPSALTLHLSRRALGACRGLGNSEPAVPSDIIVIGVELVFVLVDRR